MSRTTVGTYQMLWDCPACGTTGLLGLDHRHCPTCGSAQDPARRYYPTDAQKIAVEDHRFHGADLACPACETPNSAKATCCVNCGSPLAGAKAVRARAEKAAGEGDSATAASAELAAVRAAEREAESKRVAVRSGAGGGSKMGLLLAVGCGGLVVLGVAGALVAETMFTREGAQSVAGHAWERTIEVQALQTATDSAWRASVPADARGVECHTEQHGTKQVADGQDCTTRNVDHGDGTFSAVQDCQPKYRSEPVYDDKCTFTVDRWVTTQTLRTFGASVTPEPTWPTSPQATATLRVGARTETYTVHLADASGKTTDCVYPQAQWASLADGAAVDVELGGLTGAVKCDTVRAH